MAIHIGIEDPDGMSLIVRASGDYAPDVMHDLRNRAVELYRELWANRLALRLSLVHPVEVEQESVEGE